MSVIQLIACSSSSSNALLGGHLAVVDALIHRPLLALSPHEPVEEHQDDEECIADYLDTTPMPQKTNQTLALYLLTDRN